jgi:hypothetical protein
VLKKRIKVRRVLYATVEHRDNHGAYPDVLDYCGNDTEHDQCGRAYTGTALFPAFWGRGVETAVLCGEQGEKGPEKPYTIKEAVDYPGRLGGPKRAPSDGPPGVKTIWIGLMIYSAGLPEFLL